jgi:hypothetical protein
MDSLGPERSPHASAIALELGDASVLDQAGGARDAAAVEGGHAV